jgi:hypothetical protein
MVVVDVIFLREFINTHLNETRNRIIRMNLFMEMFTLGVTFAACASSIFGMNLKSGKCKN